MPDLARVEGVLYRIVDRVADVRSRPVPTGERLAGCRIVSHRGEHDNQRVKENTLAAFEAASSAGVWGLEFDIRWTRDHHPVVFHDRNLKRMFADGSAVSDHSRSELEKRFPLIPGLEEVVSRYGRNRHLMIELKGADGIDPRLRTRALRRELAPLDPGRDYHLISLRPEIFSRIDWVPPDTFLPIGRLNLRACSRLALEKGYGGVTGHYQLLSGGMLAVHQGRGQQVGTGFPASRNVLFREILRGVDWIFSNQAVRLQAICDHYLYGAGSGPG